MWRRKRVALDSTAISGQKRHASNNFVNRRKEGDSTQHSSGEIMAEVAMKPPQLPWRSHFAYIRESRKLRKLRILAKRSKQKKDLDSVKAHRTQLETVESDCRREFFDSHPEQKEYWLKFEGAVDGTQGDSTQASDMGMDVSAFQDENINFCDICNLSFSSSSKLSLHEEQDHTTCEIDGCQYVSNSEDMEDHIMTLHVSGLYNKMCMGNSPEEIKKYVEERARKYPTKSVLEAEKEKRKAKQSKYDECQERRLEEISENRKYSNAIYSKKRLINAQMTKMERETTVHEKEVEVKEKPRPKRVKKRGKNVANSQQNDRNNDSVKCQNKRKSEYADPPFTDSDEDDGHYTRKYGLLPYKGLPDSILESKESVVDILDEGSIDEEAIDDLISDEDDDWYMEKEEKNENLCDTTVQEFLNDAEKEMKFKKQTEDVVIAEENVEVASVCENKSPLVIESPYLKSMNALDRKVEIEDNEAPLEIPIVKKVTSTTPQDSLPLVSKVNEKSDKPLIEYDAEYRERLIETVSEINRLNKQNVYRHKRGDQGMSDRRHLSDVGNNNGRTLTLLEKLLEEEVKREQLQILQCIRYVCGKNFFMK